MKPITAYIALGSNLGDRLANLKRALAMIIETPQLDLRRCSSVIENPAVGDDDSPDFLNQVIEVQTVLPPVHLMRRLLEVEKTMGRERRTKWEPRVIDLDLLLHGESIVSSDELMVPHPLMHERRFVLEPLVEIAPRANHPVLQVSAQTMLENLLAAEKRRIREERQESTN
jgi:2-amino-4-hydroxy-6-hydroxymethyldihydropteridine diphosphokinase